METNREQRKELAVKLMKQLDIYNPYINGFAKSDKVCYFERFGGYWDYQDEILHEKRKELEAKYGFTVYAITHDYCDDMELYSMLIVPKDTESQDELVMPIGHGAYAAFAYVWNKTCPEYSEFGDVTVVSRAGGIERIA